MKRFSALLVVVLFGLLILPHERALGQGVTTAALTGFVIEEAGEPIPGANVVAVHEPTGTRYGAATRSSGAFTIQNMRVGGPYTVTVTFIGYEEKQETDVNLNLGQSLRLDFELAPTEVALDVVQVTGEQDDVLNAGRTGAATFIDPDQVTALPSINRSTRDLIRTDPRNDGNFSFGGRNWLYNNVSLDGSYFNNPYGLDDPAPGGQANAEPVPFDAVEQVQVSVAPFDVREGGFTGANVNTVTKSGSNEFRASVYTYLRNEDLQGNTVRGNEVIANPELSFNQSGMTFSGPILRDKLFFFANGEISRRDDPGTNFVASTGNTGAGVSRVEQDVMEQIRQRMIDVYDYDPGNFQDFIHETNNNKLIVKLDWNVNDNHNLSFRWNFLDASRDLPPHPFAISFANTGRGPNESSLPFQNAGYTINNRLHSFALELNSRGDAWSNRFFASYNRFRDFREAFSEPFPTIEIGEDGVTYTTLGHEPFSIHNILDQDVLQLTNNVSYYKGSHILTGGVNFELFSFFNSFNLFRHGLFPAPPVAGGTTFSSLDEFFELTDPDSPNFIDFQAMVTPEDVPFKGEFIDVGQLGIYAQDEFLVSPQLSLTYGLRVDFPMYFTSPVDNPNSRELTALDENDESVVVDQSELPGATPLFSPRFGFNWDVTGDRSTQLRGGTGIFTGRVPFVWVGNILSNPGANSNLFPEIPLEEVPEDQVTQDNSILQQSFDLNAMADDFKWPQVWTTDFAIDQQLPWDLLGTLEVIYGKDLNSIVMRNYDLAEPIRTLADGRPYFGAQEGANELNPDGGAGIYVIDNTSDGYNFNVTAQFRKNFDFGLRTNVSYSFTEAKSQLKSTEIASALWQELPVQGDPNDPALGFSEFGHRNRIVANANYRHVWSDNLTTSVGLFFEAADGNRFAGAGGNRYSFLYSGDVNGDGSGSNDLIFIPRDASEINLAPSAELGTPEEQWQRLDAFIEQDPYLSTNRGQIAERFGALNPWYTNIDLRILQDVVFRAGGMPQRFQLSLDVLNVANLFNSDWGVRKAASAAATSPLTLVDFDADGEPVFNFTGPDETFVDDPSILSRWQVQMGVKYMFN